MALTINPVILSFVGVFVALGFIFYIIRRIRDYSFKCEQEEKQERSEKLFQTLGQEWLEVYEQLKACTYTSSVNILFDQLKQKPMPSLSIKAYEVMMNAVNCHIFDRNDDRRTVYTILQNFVKVT